MLFDPVWNKVSIQEALLLISKFKLHILILHIYQYFLRYFHYALITSCAANTKYVWCCSGCDTEPDLGEVPLHGKLGYSVKTK